MSYHLYGSNFESAVIEFFHEWEHDAWFVEESSLQKALGLNDRDMAILFNNAEYRVHESKRSYRTYYLIPTTDVYLTLRKSKLSLWIHDEQFVYLPLRVKNRMSSEDLITRIGTTSKHLDRYLALYNKSEAKYNDAIFKTANRLELMVSEAKQYGIIPQNRISLRRAVTLIEEARAYHIARRPSHQ